MIHVPVTQADITSANAIVGARMRELTFIYRSDANGNLRLIYESVRSCYGKGYWIPEKPWLDDDKWKDNR